MANTIRDKNILKKLGGSDLITLGELTELTNLRLSTLQFYTNIGLIPFSAGGDKLTRRFEKSKALKRVSEIIKLKEKRLTIKEIKQHFNGK